MSSTSISHTTSATSVPNISIDNSVGSSIINSVNKVNDTLFTKSTTSIFIACVSLYILFLGIVELGRPEMTTDPELLASNRRVDIIVLVIFILLVLYYYLSMTAEQQKHWGSTTLHDFKVYYNDPMSLPWFLLIMFSFYFLVYIFGISMKQNEKPFSILLVEVKLFIWLGSVLIADFFIFVLGVPIIDDLYKWVGKWWDSLPSDTSGSGVISGHSILGLEDTISQKGADITPASYHVGSGSGSGSGSSFDISHCPTTPAPEIDKKEVFHVGNNNYTYDQARQVCSSFNATLATYDQLEDYYNQGGEFCAYGWSEGQMGLFPTQQSTIDRLKSKKGHEHDCGRKSINGGFFVNPNLQFGANCYGEKPLPTDAQLAMMNMQNITESKQDVDIKNKEDFYNKNKASIMKQQNMSAFNKNRWSEY